MLVPAATGVAKLTVTFRCENVEAMLSHADVFDAKTACPKFESIAIVANNNKTEGVIPEPNKIQSE